MFEEAQLYSPVTQREDGKVEVHLGQDHPGVQRPGVPQASQRDRRRRHGVDARRADPARRLHRGRARDLARRLPRAARQAREVRLPRLPGGQGPPRAARGPRPAAQRGDRRPAPAHRLRVPLRSRPRPAARVLRRAGRPRLPLDAVRPPPVRAALHARAGHHPRGHRPREHAREPAASPRSSAWPARPPAASRPTRPCRSSPTSSGSRSSSASSARAASCKAYGAGILSSYGEIEEFRHTEIRPLDLAEMSTIEYDITKYQPILYAAESMDHLEDVVGGFFATRRRRHARASARAARGGLAAGARHRRALATGGRRQEAGAHHSRSRMLSSSSARVCSTVRPGVSRWSR